MPWPMQIDVLFCAECCSEIVTGGLCANGCHADGELGTRRVVHVTYTRTATYESVQSIHPAVYAHPHRPATPVRVHPDHDQREDYHL